MNKEYKDIINGFNTVKSIESFRQEVNEECDKRIKRINLLDEANNLSDKSFGYIKECFESISPKLFESNSGKKLINKYTETIKNSKNLNTLHTIYENIRKAGKNSDIDFIINNIVAENFNLNSKQTKKDVKELGNVLAEAYILLSENKNSLIPEENKQLDNAVNFIAENKKSIKNLSEFSSAVKVIREEIEKHDNAVSHHISEKNIDEMTEMLVREFNEKYLEQLTDEEKKLVKELSESANKEEIFNKYKGICSNKITEARDAFQKEGNIESVNKLNNLFEQISNKVYVEETLTGDLFNFMEMTSIFED